jgi:putative ABC transport system substrate-binding protein
MRILLPALVLLLGALPAPGQRASGKLGVFFFHESPYDAEAFEGIQDGLRAAGLTAPLDVKRARGDEETARRQLREWLSDRPDLIFTMGTKATLLAKEVHAEVPIVFTAVTNPVRSGVTPDWRSSGSNLAGNSNRIASEDVLAVFRRALPKLRRLGVLFNPENPVSSAEVEEMARTLKLDPASGVTLVEGQVRRREEIAAAAASIAERCDALWIPIDILLYENPGELEKVTVPRRLPMVATARSKAEDIAVVGVGIDYRTLGKAVVPLAVRILRDRARPRDLPIGRLRGVKVVVNLSAAAKIGWEPPLDLLTVADRVVGP